MRSWLNCHFNRQIRNAEGILVGQVEQRATLPGLVRSRCEAPLIALSERPDLGETLDLFDAGADDVVRKPVHPRELIARMRAVRRRASDRTLYEGRGLKVFADGRDPETNGETLPLPRREANILRFLAEAPGRWATRGQVHSRLYGLFDAGVDETAVEAHVSKLRRKLRLALSHDPIESKRFSGYRLRPAT